MGPDVDDGSFGSTPGAHLIFNEVFDFFPHLETIDGLDDLLRFSQVIVSKPRTARSRFRDCC